MTSWAADLGYLALTAAAAAGFASAAAGRVRLALEAHRGGNRFEVVRSTSLAVVMSLFTVGASCGTVVRLLRIALGSH